MHSEYARVFQDVDAVEKYEHIVYAPDSYSSAVDARQREWLRDLVVRLFRKPPTHHDFACGTGRAIRALHGLVLAAHGYDTSSAMLDKAYRTGVEADLHIVAETGDLPSPATDTRPALVTVFRLLLNVDPEIRDRAIAFAARILPDPDAGLLVVENHGRRESLRHLGRWRHRRAAWFAELSDADVTDLLARHGFTVVERHGFAVTTQGCYRRRWLRATARRLDEWKGDSPLATNMLYVARRS